MILPIPKDTLVIISIYPSIYISIEPFIHPPIHMSLHPLIHPSIRPTIRPSIHISIHSFLYSSTHSSIHPVLMVTLVFSNKKQIFTQWLFVEDWSQSDRSSAECFPWGPHSLLRIDLSLIVLQLSASPETTLIVEDWSQSDHSSAECFTRCPHSLSGIDLSLIILQLSVLPEVHTHCRGLISVWSFFSWVLPLRSTLTVEDWSQSDRSSAECFARGPHSLSRIDLSLIVLQLSASPEVHTHCRGLISVWSFFSWVLPLRSTLTVEDWSQSDRSSTECFPRGPHSLSRIDLSLIVLQLSASPEVHTHCRGLISVWSFFSWVFCPRSTLTVEDWSQSDRSSAECFPWGPHSLSRIDLSLIVLQLSASPEVYTHCRGLISVWSFFSWVFCPRSTLTVEDWSQSDRSSAECFPWGPHSLSRIDLSLIVLQLSASPEVHTHCRGLISVWLFFSWVFCPRSTLTVEDWSQSDRSSAECFPRGPRSLSGIDLSLIVLQLSASP